MNKPLWLWLVFFGIVFCLLTFDLLGLQRKSENTRLSTTLWASAFYIFAGVLFSVWIGYQLGLESAKAYMAGFLIEKSLAVDNVFIIALIFGFMGIPLRYQRRVLFWGIVGVIILRAIMIAIGAKLVAEFTWIFYVFSGILIITGIKMLILSRRQEKVDLNQNPLLKLMRKHLRITPGLHGEKFFVRMPDLKTGKLVLFCTPLFITLVLVECADLIFAIDSVPAIFSLTSDPYIVYTSNIFAILGLRTLYFSLAAVIHRFAYLKHALAVILIFIGSKIFISDLLGMDKFPTGISLAVVFGLLTAGVLYSFYQTRNKA